MALVKCKECKQDVSSKAQKCPHCGVKIPKRIGLIGWLFIIFIFIPFVITLALPSENNASTASSTYTSKTTQTQSKIKQALPEPAWTTFGSKDEMTGQSQHFAISPSVDASPGMDFPYQRTEATLSFGCDKSSEWVYLAFNQAPNLSNTETKDGYNLTRARVKWDDNIVSETLTQDWQSKFIHFRDDENVATRIQSHKVAKLELKWHSQQPTYFNLSLNGSSKAIQQARAECAKT